MDIEKVKKALGLEFGVIWEVMIEVLKELNIPKDAKILDIGTGVGNLAITLALNGYTVLTGEPEDDTSEYAKQEWLENAKKAEIDHLISFQPFNAEKMPFEDGMFDAIFVYGALHHMDNKKAVLNECARIVKPSGLICISEPTKKAMRFILKRFPTHPDPVDPRDYAENLKVEIIENLSFNTYIFRK